MCKKHWARWRRHGDTSVVLAKTGTRKYPPICSVEGCESKHHANGYCASHNFRQKKYGNPLEPPRKPTGRPFKGAQPGYDAAHRRIHRTLGAATRFTCVECGAPANEWAYQGGDPDELITQPELRKEHPNLRYSVNAEFYAPMCRPCHRRMDESLNRPRDEMGRFARNPTTSIHHP